MFEGTDKYKAITREEADKLLKSASGFLGMFTDEQAGAHWMLTGENASKLLRTLEDIPDFGNTTDVEAALQDLRDASQAVEEARIRVRQSIARWLAEGTENGV